MDVVKTQNSPDTKESIRSKVEKYVQKMKNGEQTYSTQIIASCLRKASEIDSAFHDSLIKEFNLSEQFGKLEETPNNSYQQGGAIEKGQVVKVRHWGNIIESQIVNVIEVGGVPKFITIIIQGEEKMVRIADILTPEEILAENKQLEEVLVVSDTLVSENPLINDNYFRINEDKILGEQRTKIIGKREVLVVEGSPDLLDGIDSYFVPEIVREKNIDLTGKTREDLIRKTIENEGKKAVARKMKPLRPDEEIYEERGEEVAYAGQEVYSAEETAEMYNSDISDEELQAYFYCHPEYPHHLFFDRYTLKETDFLEKGLIAYHSDKKQYLYEYIGGNVRKKRSDLIKEKKTFIERYGEVQHDRQLKMLDDVIEKKLPSMSFVRGANRISLLPISKFVKEQKITELRYNKPDFYGKEISLFDAFKSWLMELPADEFKLTTVKDINIYYLENKPPKISKQLSPVQYAKEKKDAINKKQWSKQEADDLFEKFMSDEIHIHDQQRIAYEWNEQFNTIVSPELNKIPVGFRISKIFKNNKPFRLSDTQRNGVPFNIVKDSGLLAWGGGVGKTGGSIATVSQSIDWGIARYPMFVVPTNTYDKWVNEIQGRWMTDIKGRRYFEKGLLPHLPPMVELGNLNIDRVKSIKKYSKIDLQQIEAIEQLLEKLKSIEEDFHPHSNIKNNENINYESHFTEFKSQNPQVSSLEYSDLGDFNLKSLFQDYISYFVSTSARNPKSFREFMISSLREHVVYLYYSSGKMKKFPEGTIFIATEEGLVRMGISENQQQKLSEKMFRILSQGEPRSKDVGSRLEEKTVSAMTTSWKNAKINIDELGIDLVCLDEAHFYKKLFTSVKGTVKRNYDGSAQTDEKGKVKRNPTIYELRSGNYPSSRALSAFAITQYVQHINKNRGVINLTATPFTNSPIEIYSMLVLTNFKTIEDLGFGDMPDFFDTFMMINYDIKLTASKVTKAQVLNGFNNLIQLKQVVFDLWDSKSIDESNIRRPKKIVLPNKEMGIETSLMPSALQAEYFKLIKQYIKGDTTYREICAGLAEEDELDYNELSDEQLVDEWEKITDKEWEEESKEISDSIRERLIAEIQKIAEKQDGFDEDDLSVDEQAGVRVLKGISMLRQVSLSPYLFQCVKSANSEPSFEQYIETSPKLKYSIECIRSVKKYHEKKGEPVSGQVIYMNAGVHPSITLPDGTVSKWKEGGFDKIKRYLVEKVGFKDYEVVLVHGKMSKSAKEKAKEQFNLGRAKVLIGSQTIAVGVDLQKNTTCLYNCYYDWNPTDANQIEWRVWRQGNRFANCRIVYPMVFGSADPLMFQYLQIKTQRFKALMDKEHVISHLDLRDVNPEELKKELITDPQEKADYHILLREDDLKGKVAYFQNRVEDLEKAQREYRTYEAKKPKVIEILNLFDSAESVANKKDGIKMDEAKRQVLIQKNKDPKELSRELSKFEKTRYDHEKDPSNRYAPVDYSKRSDDEIFKAVNKYLSKIDTMVLNDRWASIYPKRHYYGSELMAWKIAYTEILRAFNKTLSPLGLKLTDIPNGVHRTRQKITELETSLAGLYSTRADLVSKYERELVENEKYQKTPEDRAREFAKINYILSELLDDETPIPIEEEEIVEPVVVLEKPLSKQERIARMENNINLLQIGVKYKKGAEKERTQTLISTMKIALKALKR